MSKDLIAYWWVVTCRCCGKETLSKRKDKKTCSVKCRKMYTRWIGGERTPTGPGLCQRAYNKPAKQGGWGHHDDILFRHRARL